MLLNDFNHALEKLCTIEVVTIAFETLHYFDQVRGRKVVQVGMIVDEDVLQSLKSLIVEFIDALSFRTSDETH